MPIEHIHTYLVHPGKHSEIPPQIGGTPVALAGKMFELLNSIYSKSDVECNIDIAFNNADDGSQYNPIRNLVIEYLREPTLAQGRRLAEQLEVVTTNRSGLGLLFLIMGIDGLNYKGADPDNMILGLSWDLCARAALATINKIP